MTKPKKATERRKGQSASKAMLGIELRDYFAAQALPIAEMQNDMDDFDDVAKTAYKIADAMLKARNNT